MVNFGQAFAVKSVRLAAGCPRVASRRGVHATMSATDSSFVYRIPVRNRRRCVWKPSGEGRRAIRAMERPSQQPRHAVGRSIVANSCARPSDAELVSLTQFGAYRRRHCEAARCPAGY